jgi:hypothetical protein
MQSIVLGGNNQRYVWGGGGGIAQIFQKNYNIFMLVTSVNNKTEHGLFRCAD